MLPVLIGAVIGAVAYSFLSDDESSTTDNNYVEEKVPEETELTLEESAEAFKALVFKARKSFFEQREEALARKDLKMVREMDEKLKLMEEYLDKATEIVERIMEKYNEEKVYAETKKEAGAAETIVTEPSETVERKKPADLIDEVYVSGKRVQPEKFVDAVTQLLNETMKRKGQEAT